MTNAELIEALQTDIREVEDDPVNTLRLMWRAADALEAAEQRIDGLQKLVDINTERCEGLRKQLRESHENYEKHLNELEAQLPKEGYWKKILQNSDGTSDYECSACLGIITNVPDDDEHPLCSFCPNCGAKMKGERR